ncbi:hypothetical protein BH11PSE12_BH11PSE12_14540 [soil metagenome]
MKLLTVLNTTCVLLSCVLANMAHAELYKWVGADGKVTYSDVPPPSNARQVETKSMSSDATAVSLPAELAAAVAKNPVTLYAAPSCTPCNEGRALLKQLGIPFSEKIVVSNEEIAKLKQISGEAQLPALIIRNSKFRGFDSAEWRTALESAGYPETSKLPKEYRYPPAESAAPATKKTIEKPAEKEPATPKLKPSLEPGIRF